MLLFFNSFGFLLLCSFTFFCNKLLLLFCFPISFAPLLFCLFSPSVPSLCFFVLLSYCEVAGKCYLKAPTPHQPSDPICHFTFSGKSRTGCPLMTCQFVSDVAAATIQPGGAVGRNIIACKSLFMDLNFTFTSWPLPNSNLGFT